MLRELKVGTYERTGLRTLGLGLRTLGLTSSEQTPMKNTHTADEATLDGEIPSQDLVYVSNAKLKLN